MANKIQIKRSATTATPTSLNAGELAFSNVVGGSGVLFIGSTDGGTVVPVGGVRNPGTLTANQALVANSTSGIDKVITANLVPNQIYANGGVGTAGYVLASGAAGNVYWVNPSSLTTSAAGSNTQIQFNDSGAFGANSNLTFDKTSNELRVGNSVSTAYLTALNGARNITTNYGSVGGAVGVATDLTVGASGSGGNVSLPSAATLKIGTTTVNSTYFTGTANNADYLGGWALANIQTWISSNADAAYTNATSYADGVAATAYSNATSYADTAASTAYSNATSYADTVAATAYSNATSYADLAAANAYSNAMSDTLSRSGSYTGNNTFGGTNTVFNSNVVFNSQIIGDLIPVANNTYSLGNSTNRWANLYISGSTIVIGNSSISDTANGISITNLEVTNNNIVANIQVTGVVTGNLNPSANATYNIGTNSMRWNEIHASNVHSITGYFDGNVEVAGNLIVSGNVTTTNVNSVIVSDPMIYLAGNNYYADLVDIGFSANYYDGATQRHTGFIRHASTDEYYLFKNLTQELDANNIVNINDSSFRLADLNAWIISGGLVSNSSNVQITANSTVGVNITGNTLTLSTALGGTSGGTGLNTYTAEDIIVANSSNGFRKLNVGTEGYVLQVSSGTVAWNSLDGGTF